MKYYVLGIWKDVEPMLSKPFHTKTERDIEARKWLFTNMTDDGGIYKLDVDSPNLVDVGNYTENELNEPDYDGAGFTNEDNVL